MQANVHTPERLSGETMENYRARRKESQRRQHLGWYIETRGSYTNPARAHKRREVEMCGGVRQYKKMVRENRLTLISQTR